MDGYRDGAEQKDVGNAGTHSGSLPHLPRSVALDKAIEAPQRAEDLYVVFVVGAKLHAELLGHDECYLPHIDRIQTESLAVELCLGIDLLGGHIQVEGGNDKPCQIRFLGGL